MEKYGWALVGTITTALTALTNQQRKVQDIGNVVTLGTTAMQIDLTIATAEFAEFRLVATGTDADINVAEVYAARDVNDDYTHVGQLTATVGTMIARGGLQLYHDTFVWVVTDEGFEAVATNSGNNDTAKLWFNTNGYSKLLFVMSTLASTSVRGEVAFVDRIELPSTSAGSDLSSLLTELTAQGVTLDSLETEQASQGTAIDLINTNLEASLIDNSASGENQVLTISSNVVAGSSQACTSCVVTWSGTGPVYVNDGGTATADDFRLPTETTGVGAPMSFPVRNLSQLNFFSSTNGDKVNIFWRA